MCMLAVSQACCIPDDNDEAYASATFAPSWFGSQYVTGNTDFTMTFHLPPNMNEQEPRWHASPAGFPSEPQAASDFNNRVTYTWYSPSASASDSYSFGASFPRSYVPADSIYVAPAQPLISGILFLLCCAAVSLLLCLLAYLPLQPLQASGARCNICRPRLRLKVTASNAD